MSEHQQTGCKLLLRNIDDVGEVMKQDMQMMSNLSDDNVDAICQKCLQKKLDDNHMCEEALAQKVKHIEE